MLVPSRLGGDPYINPAERLACTLNATGDHPRPRLTWPSPCAAAGRVSDAPDARRGRPQACIFRPSSISSLHARERQERIIIVCAADAVQMMGRVIAPS